MSFDNRHGTKLYTRHMNQCTYQYPEFKNISFSAQNAVLDGEMVVLDVDNKPSFENVMKRFQASNDLSIRKGMNAIPACFVAFDILQKNGISLVHKPLEERLEILREVLIPNDHLTFVETFEDGETLFQASRNMGLEGIVSKCRTSPYLVGRRANQGEWVKVKNWIVDTVEIIGLRKGEFWMGSGTGWKVHRGMRVCPS